MKINLKGHSRWLYFWHKFMVFKSFRVQYNENELSERMYLKVAKEYASIFKAQEIIFDPDPNASILNGK